MIHVLRVAMEEYARDVDGEVRWCFVCRKRVGFFRVCSRPIDPMSYYGPSARIECERGHVDGDFFPGRERMWGEE